MLEKNVGGPCGGRSHSDDATSTTTTAAASPQPMSNPPPFSLLWCVDQNLSIDCSIEPSTHRRLSLFCFSLCWRRHALSPSTHATRTPKRSSSYAHKSALFSSPSAQCLNLVHLKKNHGNVRPPAGTLLRSFVRSFVCSALTRHGREALLALPPVHPWMVWLE